MNFDSQPTDQTTPPERIDQLCDAFEAAWLTGERPLIADYIGRLGDEEQPALFYELMLVELEFRLKAGERPSRADYLRDFPRFSGQVSAVYLEFGAKAFATAGAKKDDTVRRRGYQPGDHIGHFELRELLGSGAMGDVWKAWDPRLQRPVAVKTPRAENLSEAEKHRFLREGRSAAQLRHPNLAAVYEVDRDGDTPYIASELVDGENLRDYCERSKLAVTTATTESINRRLTFFAIADLCAEIAEALHHAHEQGVVHRDLKPANVIIDRANRPHVIDFGLARWATDEHHPTLHGELLGTPAYMSPEQAAGNAAKLDRRTDVYSLGVILYELLCGQCPFTGEMGSMIHRIIAVEPSPVRKLNVKVPRDLETVCIKALEKNPDRRYATMQEMAVDLRRFARGEPILARRAGPFERSWRWVRRHPGVAAAMLVIVLILSTSGSMIYSLIEQNYHAQGYRQVLLQDPSGGRAAFVPIDKRTGEPDPNPAGIVRVDTIPTTLWMKPGEYFKESVLTRSDGTVDLAEDYVTIPEAGMTSESERSTHRSKGKDEDLYMSSARMELSERVIRDMVAVPISESLRRRDPLLPSLLYVDAEVTLPASYAREVATSDGLPSFWHFRREFCPLKYAMSHLRESGKRLPSASECEAIQRAILEGVELHDASGHVVRLSPGPAPSAVWTSTIYRFPGYAQPSAMAQLGEQHVLSITGDPDAIAGATRIDSETIARPSVQSRYIGFRGVRSATPRFVKP